MNKLRWTQRDSRNFRAETFAMDAVRRAASPQLLGAGLTTYIVRTVLLGLADPASIIAYGSHCLDDGKWRYLQDDEVRRLIKAAARHKIKDKGDYARARRRWEK